MVEVGQTVWITKYALTSGIREAVVGIVHEGGSIKLTGSAHPCFGRYEYFTTEQEAYADALQQIAAKRESIAKQLEKLDRLERKMLAGVKL